MQMGKGVENFYGDFQGRKKIEVLCLVELLSFLSIFPQRWKDISAKCAPATRFGAVEDLLKTATLEAVLNHSNTANS